MEKAALPAGEGAGVEETRTDADTMEAIDSDRSQPEEPEAAGSQVSEQGKGRLWEEVPWLECCVMESAGNSSGGRTGLWPLCGNLVHQIYMYIYKYVFMYIMCNFIFIFLFNIFIFIIFLI